MRATVVIPCFRPDDNLEKMLGDLNAQSSKEFEVIVVDDGNAEPIEPRIQAGLNRPHRVIRFEENRGIVAGLNVGVAAVRTPYIIRMDADDRMSSRRIERQLAFMEANPEVDIAGSSMAVFGSGLRVWTKPAEHDTIVAGLLWSPSLHHPTVVARREVLQDNPYPEGFHLAEDYALWLTLAAKGVRMANSPGVEVYYRMEGQNTSQENTQRRSVRYLALWRQALATLLPEGLEHLEPGLDAGCHHVLAGVPLPEGWDRPSLSHLVSHVDALRTQLLLHGEKTGEAWVDSAIQDLADRLDQASSRTKWHKLGSVWALSRLTLGDWLLLLGRSR